MGRDKLSLKVGGIPLLERVYSVLIRLCEEVVIVGDGGAGAAPDATRIKDSRPDRQGPLAGLEAGLETVEGRVVVVVAGDMPFVPEGLLAHLGQLIREGSQAAVPVEGERIHPLCAAYDGSILPVVKGALDSGARDMRGFLSRLESVSYVSVDEGEFGEAGVILLNVNSPEDLARAGIVAEGLAQ